MKIFKLLCLALAIITSYTLSAQVAISTDGSDPDGSAMLDVQSTTKGFLPPRMTQAQIEAIADPADGLTVFNTTDEKLYIFTEADNEWKEVEYGLGIITPPNLPPVASDVNFSGTLKVGQTLTGSYTYTDYEDDPEGTSTFQWYRADDVAGTNQAAISGATAQTYQITIDDNEKFIAFEITPVAQTGTSTGAQVISDYDGPISAIGVSYQGGIIAYILQAGDPGFVEGETRGLIAATSDQSTAAEWGCYGTEISGADGTALGTGIQNTFDIVMGCSTAGIAAKICADLDVDGYDDWFLPSKDELNKLYLSRDLLGGFSDHVWWSSSEESSPTAWRQNLSNGNTYNSNKNNGFHVRAIRAFPAQNLAPATYNVSYSGTLEIGQTLTGSYTYADFDNDAEGTSTFQWYRADDVAGTNQSAISGETAQTYQITIDDNEKFIAFEVTPVAQTGTSPGAAALSAYQAVINLAPVASNVSFSGTLEVGQTLISDYTYADNESDLEGTSTFQWHRADDAAGNGQAAISGATADTYVLIEADDAKYISFEVTPVALTGTSPGTVVMTDYDGPVTTPVAFACGDALVDARDSKSYSTVLIGTQCWMAENLNYDQSNFGNDWCYNNNASNCETYGRLYDWDAIMQGAASSSNNPSGVQGVCSAGWHLPSDDEWTELTTYVSSQSAWLCNSSADYNAKALAATTNWYASTYLCAVGNDKGANNATGFTALPGGYYFSGSYSVVGLFGYWWSCSQLSSAYAWYRQMSYASGGVGRTNVNKDYGVSVRCLRD